MGTVREAERQENQRTRDAREQEERTRTRDAKLHDRRLVRDTEREIQQQQELDMRVRAPLVLGQVSSPKEYDTFARVLRQPSATRKSTVGMPCARVSPFFCLRWHCLAGRRYSVWRTR